MSEELIIDQNASREEKYKALIPQIEALLDGEEDWIANMANVASAIHQTFKFWWVGFYRAEAGQLVLGPFQGPIACTRIPFQKGVCGACYTQQKTMLVPDVNQFPGHIACSSATQSEIVVPIWNKDRTAIIAVLDVDSDQPNDFGSADQKGLEKIAAFLAR